MHKVHPLFKSHYSIGRSILTLSSAEPKPKDYPDSIIDICKKNDLNKFFLIDDGMGGFLEAYQNAKDNNLQLIFGLRITICEDLTEKNEPQRAEKSSKCVLIARDTEGYQNLIKIYTKAAREGFYYEPRIDYNFLKNTWDESLCLAIPFYDSFLHKNALHGALCMPDFSFAEPVFFQEENDLFIDDLIAKRLREYCKDKYEIIDSKSIYYNERKDFKAYLTFRCINNRSSLNKPEFNNMNSNEFCFESWKEQNG